MNPSDACPQSMNPFSSPSRLCDDRLRVDGEPILQGHAELRRARDQADGLVPAGRLVPHHPGRRVRRGLLLLLLLRQLDHLLHEEQALLAVLGRLSLQGAKVGGEENRGTGKYTTGKGQRDTAQLSLLPMRPDA